ncbi:MAG: MBL fold metallo-hydrolase [Phycisphaeraceae bacterium]|nr:MBL fold metallo-hydrolase [Phycisphaeraceae bacterium]
MLTPTRRDFLGLSLAALASLSGFARAAPARLRAGTYFPWSTLADNVWVTVSPTQGGNVIVAKARDGCLVIDSKFAGMGPTLRREAVDLAGPVRALLNTHHHGDHTGGNVAFADPNIDTLAHPKARARIREAHQQYLAQLRGAMRQLGPDLNPAVQAELDALLLREDRLTPQDWTPRKDAPLPDSGRGETDDLELLPGLNIRLGHYGPGHTDNDMTVWLCEADIVHTGDLCFHNLHPFFDASAGVTARGWITSLKAVLQRCTRDTKVVPGHGPVGDRAIIEKQIAYLEALIEAVAKEIRSGKTKEDISAMSWPFMEGLGFEQVRSRAINAVYDELAGSP